MSSIEAKVAIWILLSLLGIVSVSLMVRFCRCLRNLDRQRREERDMEKPHIIQMALINATTATMQPFFVSD